MAYEAKMVFHIIFITIPYIIAYLNLAPYKVKFLDVIVMELTIILGYSIIALFNVNLASLAVYFIPVLFIYKNLKKVLGSILFNILICIIIIVSDSAIGCAVSYIFKDKFQVGNLVYVFTCISILIAIYVFSKLTSYLINKYRIFINQNYKSKYAILVYIAVFVTFGLFYMNINWNSSSDPIYLTRINGLIFAIFGVILAIICVIIFNTIKKEAYFYYSSIYLENLKQYTSNLEDVYMDMRKFRHDYINILAAIRGFIDDRDMDGLNRYFNENIYPLNQSLTENNFKLGKLQNIKITEIKGLIATKLLRAQELGINVNIEIVDSVEEINMEIVDLIRSLGILLDNATEAAAESERKELTLAFIVKSTSVIIIIENTFESKEISISKMFEEGYSTKGNNRGLGLSNLKGFIDRHKNILLETSMDSDIFTQILTIAN